MHLSAFKDRYVLVQFREPYTWMVPVADRDKLVPTQVPIPGQPEPPPGQQKQMTLLRVPFLMGKVKLIEEAGMGGFQTVLRIADPTGAYIDVELADEMIFSISAVSQDRIITP